MRNPRTDPQPGDIVRWRDRERHVVDVRDAWYASDLGRKAVSYRDVRKRGDVGGARCSLAAWRKWASRPAASVIQTAELVEFIETEAGGHG